MNPYALNSIAATYPGFQALPKSIKQMLLVTESVYFEDARPHQPGAPHHNVPHEVLHLAHPGAQYESTRPGVRPN